MKSLTSITRIFSAFDDAIYIVDKDRKILYFNHEAERLSGFTAKEIVGKFCYDNILNHVDYCGNCLCTSNCPLLKSISDDVVMDADVFMHHRDGHRLPVHVRSIPYVSGNKTIGAVEIFHLLTERDDFNEKELIADSLSMIDPLTGLLNRHFLTNKLEGILAKQNNNYAVLFLDLDDFKRANDTYGHLVGDSVLEIVSRTILAATGVDDYIIRFGGEEILAILKVSDIDEAYRRAENLRVLIGTSEQRIINYRPQVTIGLTMYRPNEPINDAIHRADKAMYVGKRNGKNQVSINSER